MRHFYEDKDVDYINDKNKNIMRKLIDTLRIKLQR